MTKTKDSNNPETLSFTSEVRVRFNETDPLGIVWHGHYIKYFEDGREAFGRAYGIDYLEIQKNGFATPIVKFVCENKLPLRYGEVVTVQTVFINNPAAKMIFQYILFNQKNELVCTGETIQVFTDFEGNLMLNSPEFFMSWKKKMQLPH
ncbi:MAG TPA: acyl-CoA thioesterase [Flavobacteriaceae bacterium]|nr:acyl-CoA thioesterase [Flavobacteriaceae bacterium]